MDTNSNYMSVYELPRKSKIEQILLGEEGSELLSGRTHGNVIDISTAFYHIDMNEVSNPYIGFKWLEKFYWYSCFPMGIHLAS